MSRLTRAAAAWKARGGTNEEWAAKLGSDAASVSRWRNGRRLPADGELRRRIEAAGGPKAAWWTEYAPATVEPATKPLEPPDDDDADDVTPAPTATPAAVTSEADRLLRTVRKLQDRVERIIDGGAGDDAAGDLAGAVRMADQLARTLAVCGRLTGVGLTITDRQVRQSPAWRRTEDIILAALEPHEAAMLAVEAALLATTPEE